MADGKRPGGLTALAVLNFVFGGLSIIYTLVAGLVVVTAHTVVNTSMEAAEKMGAKGEDLHNASSSAKGSVVPLLPCRPTRTSCSKSTASTP